MSLQERSVDGARPGGPRALRRAGHLHARRSSSPGPRAPASGTPKGASTSTSPAASAARTSATTSPPSSTRSTPRSTGTSTSASWSGCTSRTSRSAAGSPSCRPTAGTTEVDPAEHGRRSGRERGQDRARRNRPPRGRRLRQRLPRPHAPLDDDDVEGRPLQGRASARSRPRSTAPPLRIRSAA